MSTNKFQNWWEDPKYWRPIADERLHSVTDQARPQFVPHRQMWTRVPCEQCGKDFFPKRRIQGTKFCSSACRQKHYRQTKKLET